MKGSNLLIGVAGPSCSGKSTLEANLNERFGESIALLSFDDFFIGMVALEGKQITNWENPDLYRWPLYADVIRNLHNGMPARFEPHSHEAKMAGITERVIMPAPLVLVTGFLALHSTTSNEYLDLKIYIDVPPEEMVRRRIERAKGRPAGAWNSEAYICDALIPATKEVVEPQREMADFIIDGLLPPTEIAGRVASIIQSAQSA